MTLLEVAEKTVQNYEKTCIKVEQDKQKTLFAMLETMLLSPEVKQRGQWGDPVVEFEFPPLTVVCRKTLIN